MDKLAANGKEKQGGETMRDCVLFDFDGTVYDTVRGITRSVRYALGKHEMDAELEELRCFAGPPLVDMFMSFCRVDQEEAEELVRDFRERYGPVGVYESEPFEGIRELLISLRQAGMKTGIATSKPQNMAELLLERSGLRELFDVVAGSDPTRENNNAKWQVLTAAMESLNAPADRCVLVGDTKYDVEGAAKIGIPCIGVRWGYAAEGELEAAGAAAIAENMRDLERLLLGEPT